MATGQSSATPVVVNKAVLEHRHTHSLMYHLCCFHTIMAAATGATWPQSLKYLLTPQKKFANSYSSR